jgi:hypothetical protein
MLHNDQAIDHTKPHLQICNHCNRPLVLIEYHERLLKGCISCNLWGRTGGRAWTHLPTHHLRTLERMMGAATRGREQSPLATSSD